MRTRFVNLTPEQMDWLEDRLAQYDDAHRPERLEGAVRIGIEADGELIAGADACMTAYRILYVSTVFVDERFRGKGIGKMLMRRVEREAMALGATIIRLDTFDFQGAGFYRALGYAQVGYYESEEEGFSEFFFVKKL